MINGLLRLMFLSVVVPQQAGEIILKIRFPLPVVAQIAALVIVLDALVIVLSHMVNPIGGGASEISTGTLISIQVISFTVMILATFLVGRMFGGTGNLTDTTLLLCWLNLIGVTIQFAQILISALLSLAPWFGAVGELIENLIAACSFCLFLWVYVHFVTIVHSFKSALKVLGGMMLTLFIIAFSAMLVMILFAA